VRDTPLMVADEEKEKKSTPRWRVDANNESRTVCYMVERQARERQRKVLFVFRRLPVQRTWVPRETR